MGTSGIPRDVEDFITSCIDTVDELEALLLLRTRQPGGLTAGELASELRIEPNAAAMCLGTLQKHGLVDDDGVTGAERRLRYRPRTLAIDGTVAGLALAYPRYRVAVITLIVSKPSDRIRSFADAFKFRKE